MRRLLAALIALVVLLALSPAAVQPFRLDDPEGKAFHHIHFDTLLEADSCSATSIGPHALITAAHCELGTDAVDVDGVSYAISQKIRDGHDHTILILPQANFKVFLPLDQRDPTTSERIRGWGWPGHGTSAVYKEGTFVKVLPPALDTPIPAWLFAYPVYAGDSGGAVITDAGKILTIVSLGDNKADMVGFLLAFTPDQLAQAAK